VSHGLRIAVYRLFACRVGWEVETESASALTVKTMEKYAMNPKMTRAQALQSASIYLINDEQVPTEWAHPVFWAPYALVGNGQR
jgi:CHAT domain-containing protein